MSPLRRLFYLPLLCAGRVLRLIADRHVRYNINAIESGSLIVPSKTNPAASYYLHRYNKMRHQVTLVHDAESIVLFINGRSRVTGWQSDFFKTMNDYWVGEREKLKTKRDALVMASTKKKLAVLEAQLADQTRVKELLKP